MMKQFLPLLLISGATMGMAEGTRDLDAHEHGVGELNIAIEGSRISMELHAPGADIVGFEYEAKSAEDRAAIDAAVAQLARPLDLFVLPTDAACTVTQASAALEGEEHEEHADEHDEHEDHAEEHDEHKENEGVHAEFHAEYQLNCAKPDKITKIDFAYFETFPNARELEVQLIGNAGAKAFEVERDAPSLDLRGMF